MKEHSSKRSGKIIGTFLAISCIDYYTRFTVASAALDRVLLVFLSIL